MQIQDAVHGYISLNEVEEELLDTPEMQRLRRVRQLGFSHLVYPSATHSRFEHSLGAFHLAGRFAASLDLDADRAQHLRLAALFHDLGHGPFSHVTDELFHEAGTRHEHFSRQKVRSSPIVDVLEEHDLDADRICGLIDGEGTLGTIIAGHIDVDRMDYLMRDAHYTGVAYGTIAADTIVRAATVADDRLVFDAQYTDALESLLTARYLMMPTVYMHRTSSIAERMFRHAYELYADAENVEVSRLAVMDDPEALARMRQSPASASMLRKVEHRELYKVGARLEPGSDRDAVRDRVLDGTDLDADAVLVDEIGLGGSGPYDVPVMRDGDITTLDQLSPVPDALQDALDQHREVRVYVPPEHVDAAAAAVPD